MMLSLIILVSIFSHSVSQNWDQKAFETLTNSLNSGPNTNLAKNVVLFIGDGLGMSTITASRIYKGQLQNKPGEETVLKFEEFPNVALMKTYCVDRQIPDSACTATALMGGVKINFEVIGLNENVKVGNCKGETRENTVTSILQHFKKDGRSTGIVTNTRLTHATPAAAYASAANRNFEDDSARQRYNIIGNCVDIAYQFVYNNHDIQVALGGGRSNFLPKTTVDPENVKGKRSDGRDLISTWKNFQDTLGRKHRYVWNKEQFDAIDPKVTDSVLGLFQGSHMQYENERNTSGLGEPSIAEMTQKAIQILKKNDKGFFLLVEGGRIDHAHHDTTAGKALQETIAFEDAVIKALELVDLKDTLVIVTADHSHVFTMGGYPARGNDILGIAEPLEYKPALDKMPYTTLAYTNGPGVNFTIGRENLTYIDTTDPNYIYQSAVPLESETHSGEDVPLFAIGPMSHLFHGVQEQNYAAHVMQYAACVGDYKNKCDRIARTAAAIVSCPVNGSPTKVYSIFALVFFLHVIIYCIH